MGIEMRSACHVQRVTIYVPNSTYPTDLFLHARPSGQPFGVTTVDENDRTVL